MPLEEILLNVKLIFLPLNRYFH